MAQWLRHLSILSPKCFKKESRWLTGPCPSHITLKHNWRNIEFYRVQIGKIVIPLFTYKWKLYVSRWLSSHEIEAPSPLLSHRRHLTPACSWDKVDRVGGALWHIQSAVEPQRCILWSPPSLQMYPFSCWWATRQHLPVSVNARSVNQTGVQTYQMTFRPSSTSLSAPPCSPLSLTTHHWSCQPNMFILTPKVNSIYPPNACPWTGGGSRNTRRAHQGTWRSDRKDPWRLLLRGKRQLTFYGQYSRASASPEVLRKIITSSFLFSCSI